MLNFKYFQKNAQLSEDQKMYLKEKIVKHRKFLDKANNLNLSVYYNKNYPPEKQFQIEVSFNMPHAFIKVVEYGKVPEEAIDKLEVVLKRRLKRYQDQKKKWDMDEPWKITQFEEEMELDYDNLPIDAYNDYEPVVTVRKYRNNQPMHVGEALERMEMQGDIAYLFKKIDTNKYCMLYKREDDRYELIEPVE